MNLMLDDHRPGILKSITDKIIFVSVSGGHESTSAVRWEFIQHISSVGKFKILGVAFNSNCKASMIWLTHEKRVDKTSIYLAIKADGL